MLSAIGTSAVTNPTLVPSVSPSQNLDTNEAVPASTTSATPSDELTLSQPETQPSSGGYYQQTSLKLRAHSHVKTTDDGQMHSMSQAKLRFRYEFEAADGTTIRIRAQANMRFSEISNNTQESQSIRLRAQARVSVLQEGVSSGISPLLNEPGFSTDAKNAISQALDLFQQVTETVTSAFMGSDPLDGDSLITGLVDAFNGFSESLSGIFLPPASAPETVPPGETGELPAPVPTEPGEVVDVEQPPVFETEPPVTEAEPPAEGESEPVAEVPVADTAPSTELEAELVQNVGEGEPAASENENVPVAGEQNPEVLPVGDSQTVETTPTEAPQPTARSVMFKLRLQVIQSLNGLAGVFDSDSSGQMVSQSRVRMSAEYAVRYNLSGTSGSNALSQDQINTQV